MVPREGPAAHYGSLESMSAAAIEAARRGLAATVIDSPYDGGASSGIGSGPAAKSWGGGESGLCIEAGMVAGCPVGPATSGEKERRRSGAGELGGG